MLELLATFVTALALATDAVAVSIAAGLARGRASVGDALRIAGCFGAFQAVMPWFGVTLGGRVRPYVEGWAPAIAGVVLVGLGAYALRDAMRDADDDAPGVDFFATRVLLGLGLATSLDAFAVGISWSLSGVPVWPSVAVVGVVTFALSFVGVRLADRVEAWAGAKARIAGGLVLVALGVGSMADAVR